MMPEPPVVPLSELVGHLVTTDNPASEDAADIAEAVVRGAREVDSKRERHVVILDRREALQHALALARSGDVVLVAGKGHEDFQLIDGVRIP